MSAFTDMTKEEQDRFLKTYQDSIIHRANEIFPSRLNDSIKINSDGSVEKISGPTVFRLKETK